MSVLRKYPKLAPLKRHRFVTIDRTLLVGVIALVGFGLAQNRLVTMASNDRGNAAMMAALRPVADYTPVGSIDSEKRESSDTGTTADAERKMVSPFGLRIFH